MDFGTHSLAELETLASDSIKRYLRGKRYAAFSFSTKDDIYIFVFCIKGRLLNMFTYVHQNIRAPRVNPSDIKLLLSVYEIEGPETSLGAAAPRYIPVGGWITFMMIDFLCKLESSQVTDIKVYLESAVPLVEQRPETPRPFPSEFDPKSAQELFNTFDIELDRIKLGFSEL